MSNSKFSPRELKFLSLYFSGQQMKDAARAAGYRGASDQALCNSGRAILNKYEDSVHPKELFRRVGASETRVAQLLLALAETGKSESVRVSALAILTKCLGLQREIEEGFQGFEIHLEGLGPPSPPPGAPRPGPPGQPPALPSPQPKTKQITK